jgi:hypothetical protein
LPFFLAIFYSSPSISPLGFTPNTPQLADR